ncbi:MAG TPA: NADH-quinone oxidoreductase subunit N, partial [Cytophagales bacterium]|nr:NADH-quinone oxidoreductase subunit N [Cytophagales bacterium]
MSLQELLLMRHEWTLIGSLLILLVLELNFTDEGKTKSIPSAAILFALVTLYGFLPSQSGTLFGGMYVTDPLRILMKNILNL